MIFENNGNRTDHGAITHPPLPIRNDEQRMPVFHATISICRDLFGVSDSDEIDICMSPSLIASHESKIFQASTYGSVPVAVQVLRNTRIITPSKKKKNKNQKAKSIAINTVLAKRVNQNLEVIDDDDWETHHRRKVARTSRSPQKSKSLDNSVLVNGDDQNHDE